MTYSGRRLLQVALLTNCSLLVATILGCCPSTVQDPLVLLHTVAISRAMASAHAISKDIYDAIPATLSDIQPLLNRDTTGASSRPAESKSLVSLSSLLAGTSPEYKQCRTKADIDTLKIHYCIRDELLRKNKITTEHLTRLQSTLAVLEGYLANGRVQYFYSVSSAASL